MKPTQILMSILFLFSSISLHSQEKGFEYSFHDIRYIQNTLQVSNGFFYHTTTELYFMDNEQNISKIKGLEGTNIDISYRISQFFTISDSSWILVLAGLASDVKEGDDILIVEFSKNKSISHHFNNLFKDHAFEYNSIALNKLGEIEILVNSGETSKKVKISNNYDKIKVEDHLNEAPKFTFDNGSTLLISETSTIIIDHNGIGIDTIHEATTPMFLSDSTLDFRSKNNFYTYSFQTKEIISKIKIPSQFKNNKKVRKNNQGYYFWKGSTITLLSDHSEKIIYTEPCKSRFSNHFFMLDNERIILVNYDNTSRDFIAKSINLDNPVTIERAQIEVFDVEFVRYGSHSDDHGIYYDYRYNFKVVNNGNIPINGIRVKSTRFVDHGYTETFLYHKDTNILYAWDTLNFSGKFSVLYDKLSNFNLLFTTNDHSLLENCQSYKFKASVKTATQLVDSIPVNIYPNPSNGYIGIDAEIDLEYSLFNPDGKQLEKGYLAKNVQDFDFSNYADGVYFLILKSKNGQTSHKKIVIQR